MKLHEYFRGDGERRGPTEKLPSAVSAEIDDPAGYLATPPVKAAVNVALNLGLPLLVTGDPGTGKSVLAKAVAYEMGFHCIEFVAKSSTVASDLLYRFDAVRHFRDEQITALRARALVSEDGEIPSEHKRGARGGRSSPLPPPPPLVPSPLVPPLTLAPYIRFQALGLAIALSYQPNDPDIKPVWDDESNRMWEERRDRAPAAPLGERGCRSVVLIDELDKAPRDVPNDLLIEIERRTFVIAETGTRLSVQGGLHPIVIITSNSEKSLPDAFLRRCVFHHIEFPKENDLARIILSRLPELRKPRDPHLQEGPVPAIRELHPLGRDGISLLSWLRPAPEGGQLSLRKPPSIAELLSWLRLLLRCGLDAAVDLRSAVLNPETRSLVDSSLGVLVKDRSDRQRVSSGDFALEKWAKSSP